MEKKRLHLLGHSVALNNITPCAACKLLRRRCAEECPFSPYFSPHEPHRFLAVHKVFGASNVSKLLMEVAENQRADAANSLVYEANVRIRDPVYGCMGAIAALQQQVHSLQAQLDAVRSEILKHDIMRSSKAAAAAAVVTASSAPCNITTASNCNNKNSTSTGEATATGYHHQHDQLMMRCSSSGTLSAVAATMPMLPPPPPLIPLISSSSTDHHQLPQRPLTPPLHSATADQAAASSSNSSSSLFSNTQNNSSNSIRFGANNDQNKAGYMCFD